MKKLLFIAFLFSAIAGYAQPVTQRASTAITVQDGRLMPQYNLFIPRFADTTAANLVRGVDSCGAVIFTYDVNGSWKRACNPKRWVQSIDQNTPVAIYTGGYNVAIPMFVYGYTSPAVGLDQGYATDGTYNYVNGASTLQQRAGDWSSTLQSVSPFTGVTGTPNHCGDIAVDNLYVYTVTERFIACGSVTQQKIVIRDKASMGTIIHQFDISAYVDEASYIEVTHDTLIVGSFCTGTTFWLFNANTGALLNTVALANTLQGIQGLGINQNDRRLYMGTETQLYRGDFNGTTLTNITPIANYPGTSTHAGEGIAVYNDTVRALLVDPTNQVYSYYDNGTKTNIISALTSGYLNASKLNIGNSLGDAPITQKGTSVDRLSLYTQGSLWGTHFGLDGTAFSLMANASYHQGWYKDDTTRGVVGWLYHYTNNDWELRTARKTTSFNFSNFQIPLAVGIYNNQINMAGNIVFDSSNQVLAGVWLHPTFPVTTFTNTSPQVLYISGTHGFPYVRLNNTATGGTDMCITVTNNGNGIGGGKLVFHDTTGTNAYYMYLDNSGNLVLKKSITTPDTLWVTKGLNLGGATGLNSSKMTVVNSTANPFVTWNNTGTSGGLLNFFWTNAANGSGTKMYIINDGTGTSGSVPFKLDVVNGNLTVKGTYTGTQYNGTIASFSNYGTFGTTSQSGTAKLTVSTNLVGSGIDITNSLAGGITTHLIPTSNGSAIGGGGLVIDSTLGGTAPAFAVFPGIGVGINTKPGTTAAFEVASTTQGALLPRMTTAQRDLINSGSFVNGLMVFNTDQARLNVYSTTLSTWRAFMLDGLTTKSYSATTNIDFNAARMQTVSLTGNVTFTTSNIRSGSEVIVRVISDGSTRTTAFPAGWTFMTATAPANIAASKVGLLHIRAYGTTDADIVATWVVQP